MWFKHLDVDAHKNFPHVTAKVIYCDKNLRHFSYSFTEAHRIQNNLIYIAKYQNFIKILL